MTDDERANRNPAVEVYPLKLADCPEIHADKLEADRVYIVESEKGVFVSLNYMGKGPVLDPRTLDVCVAHCFYGPRANLRVAFLPQPDGTLADGEGHIVRIREYNGPDA